MPADLVDFLRARLDDDEQTAREAAKIDGDQWSVAGPSSNDPDRVEGNTGWGAVGYDMVEPVVHHVARHDPARVLREVAAKRAILERYAVSVKEAELSAGGWADGYDRALELCVRSVAAVYADHPAYRAEWAIR